jgi:hypothetical protein
MDYLYADEMEIWLGRLEKYASIMRDIDIRDPKTFAYLKLIAIAASAVLKIYEEMLRHEHLQG